MAHVKERTMFEKFKLMERGQQLAAGIDKTSDFHGGLKLLPRMISHDDLTLLYSSRPSRHAVSRFLLHRSRDSVANLDASRGGKGPEDRGPLSG